MLISPVITNRRRFVNTLTESIEKVLKRSKITLLGSLITIFQVPLNKNIYRLQVETVFFTCFNSKIMISGIT
jgi:hypothetical protein